MDSMQQNMLPMSSQQIISPVNHFLKKTYQIESTLIKFIILAYFLN